MSEIQLLIDAHKQACHRDNASTVVLKTAYMANGNNIIPAIVAALSTLGGSHAPIKLAYIMVDKLLGKQQEFIDHYVAERDIVYGFGSSFVKGEYDLMLMDLYEYFDVTHDYLFYVHLMKKMRRALKLKGKNLYPNLAFYTAAIAHKNKINIKFCETLMIEARIAEWHNILHGL